MHVQTGFANNQTKFPFPKHETKQSVLLKGINNSCSNKQDSNGFSYQYKQIGSNASPESDVLSVTTAACDDDYFAESSSCNVTSFSADLLAKRDAIDDDVSSHSSDDTVYESDAMASACATPMGDDTRLRRSYRSTSPPSRNVTPTSISATPIANKGMSFKDNLQHNWGCKR